MDVLQVLKAIDEKLERIAVSFEAIAQSYVKKSKPEKKATEGDQA